MSLCSPMMAEVTNVHETRGGVAFDRSTPRLRFPESFQRTAPMETTDKHLDDVSDCTPPSEPNSPIFPPPSSVDNAVQDEDEIPGPHRGSRSGVMRLENILNAVSIGYDPHPDRWRAHNSESPVQGHYNSFESSPPSSNSALRSQSSDEAAPTVKKKKVKMHRCPECQKDFPRPSGLRTHMNMHTKEKPYSCSYPGCARTFSVVSNAKRHMRTHGVGLSSDETNSAPAPYVVGFEVPVVVAPSAPEAAGGKSPVRLRWIPLAADGKWSGGPVPSSIEMDE